MPGTKSPPYEPSLTLPGFCSWSGVGGLLLLPWAPLFLGSRGLTLSTVCGSQTCPPSLVWSSPLPTPTLTQDSKAKMPTGRAASVQGPEDPIPFYPHQARAGRGVPASRLGTGSEGQPPAPLHHPQASRGLTLRSRGGLCAQPGRGARGLGTSWEQSASSLRGATPGVWLWAP